MDFGRLITAMVTPFDQDGEINWSAVTLLVDYLIEEQRSEALVVCGTTGESPTLSDREKTQLFSFVKKQAQGRARIIAGTGSNCTKHSIELTREAELSGADGVLLVVPYYNKPNQEGLYRHFAAVAAQTKLPVMLYNIPGRTGVSLSVDTTLRLARIPNIIATKECASIEQITRLAAGSPDGFRVYSGDDSMALPALAVGAHGVVSVASHIAGSRISDMICSFSKGDVKQAGQIHRDLFPVFKGLFECPQPLPNPAAVKYALCKRGLDVGSVRLPLVGPTPEEAVFIDKIIQ